MAEDRFTLSGHEADLPTDLLAGLLMEQRDAPASRRDAPERLTPKIYAAMAVTTALTFATLTTGYQLLFTHHPFA